MAGEMTESEVTPEAFPLHFAVAEKLGGSVKPFDVYQGPYVVIGADLRVGDSPYAVAPSHMGIVRLWLIYCEDDNAYWYNEANEKESAPFWPYWKDDDMAAMQAVSAAREVL